MLHDPPRLGKVEQDAVDIGDLDTVVDVAHLERERHAATEERFHVLASLSREVVAELVTDDLSERPDRAQERDRQRSGPDSRLEHSSAREDVGRHEDRPEILRVDDLRAAGHLEHELGERRSDGDEALTARGAHRRAVGRSDEVVVRDDARVGVERARDDEGDEMAPLLRVGEQHAFAGGEGTVHSGLTPRSTGTARARS